MSFALRILVHHGRACPYCGVIMQVKGRRASTKPRFPTRDHVIPKSVMPAMGTVIVCRKCNLDKGNRTVMEWYLHLQAIADPRSSFVSRFMQENQHLKHLKSSPRQA